MGSESQTHVPRFRGDPITPGWWWLQFSDGPGPRHWDGTFWDRGSIFVGAEDYAEFPILGPCIPPPTAGESDYTAFEAFATRAYGWTVDVNGQLCGLVAGDMGYEDTGVNIGVLIRDALSKSSGTPAAEDIRDELMELVEVCRAALRSGTDA